MTTTDRRAARRPLHVGVLLGLSAATYAASLAGVAGLQSEADGALIADRQPTLDALADLTSRNDARERNVDAARSSYDRLAVAYQGLVEDVTALEGRIDRLATDVATVAKVSAALPARAVLPRSVAPAGRATRPASHATTGASGAP